MVIDLLRTLPGLTDSVARPPLKAVVARVFFFSRNEILPVGTPPPGASGSTSAVRLSDATLLALEHRVRHQDDLGTGRADRLRDAAGPDSGRTGTAAVHGGDRVAAEAQAADRQDRPVGAVQRDRGQRLGAVEEVNRARRPAPARNAQGVTVAVQRDRLAEDRRAGR